MLVAARDTEIEGTTAENGPPAGHTTTLVPPASTARRMYIATDDE
jgi:hypothetical protein